MKNGLLDERLVGDDVDVDGHEEAEGSVAEGDGREQLRLFGRRADHPFSVAKNHLETAANVLEQKFEEIEKHVNRKMFSKVLKRKKT